jgi:hypothetical protein
MKVYMQMLIKWQKYAAGIGHITTMMYRGFWASYNI